MSDNVRIASQFPFAKRNKGRHDAQTEQSSVLGKFPVQSVGNDAPMRPPYTENRGRRGAKAASGRKRADAESRTRGEEPYAATLPTGGKSDAKKGCLTRFRQPFFIHTAIRELFRIRNSQRVENTCWTALIHSYRHSGVCPSRQCPKGKKLAGQPLPLTAGRSVCAAPGPCGGTLFRPAPS